MGRKFWLGLAVGLFLFGTGMSANAALINIGTVSLETSYNHFQDYDLIWDNFDNDGQSVVWLDYTENKRDWPGQNQWIGFLNDTVPDLNPIQSIALKPGFQIAWNGSQWRLPDTVDGLFVMGYDGSTTGGYNIISSELGHLFYVELGNAISGLNNTGPFTHIAAAAYWSGTEYSIDPSTAWVFDFSNGLQGVGPKVNYSVTNDQKYTTEINVWKYAMALRNATVTYTELNNGPAPIPEPASAMLFVTGLLFALGLKRRNQSSVD